MTTRTWEPPPRQQDRDRQPASPESDEPRDFETQVSEVGANDDARYPLDEDEQAINTHGSER